MAAGSRNSFSLFTSQGRHDDSEENSQRLPRTLSMPTLCALEFAASVAAMGTGIPVIWHVHDSLPRHPVSSAIRPLSCLARMTRVIAVSNATTKRVIGILPIGKRVQTIYNGVDLSSFPTKREENLEFRKTIGISEEDFLVCAVGQICARKGLLELIYALRYIVPQAPHMHLAIVGKVVFRHEEEYLDALRATSRVLGIENRIHFTGELYDVSPALQASDLLVLNSRDEPFGLVLIEAMASGTPVLATRVGGIPEIVTDSENGWLIESGDTASLASTLARIITQFSRPCASCRQSATHYLPPILVETVSARTSETLCRTGPELRSELERAQSPCACAKREQPRSLTCLRSRFFRIILRNTVERNE